MPQLQATWTQQGHLFFWAPEGDVDELIDAQLSDLAGRGETVRRTLALPGEPIQRKRIPGRAIPAGEAAAVLARLPANTPTSDSIRCWALTSLLALEMAAGQRVVPTVQQQEGRWRALLTRSEDRSRLSGLARSLPTVARCEPTQTRGKLTLPTACHALRAFLDAAIDDTFRQNAYPGSARGWELALAESLRGPEAGFNPRDARFHGVGSMLRAWTDEAEATTLALGLTLSLPDSEGGGFHLAPWLHPVGQPDVRIPLMQAWSAGDALEVGERTHVHPAHAVLRGLSRAAGIFPPLIRCLEGSTPRPLDLDAHDTWALLAEGADLLTEAGMRVEIPDAFAEAGNQRLRARKFITVEQTPGAGGGALPGLLRFRWEVVLGDQVIDGNEFAELCERREPIVRFRDGWVLLDPAEIAKLPSGLPQEGVLPAVEALRALLIGQHEGVAVVADAMLEQVLASLGDPPVTELPDTLQGTLRPYQRYGFNWLANLGRLGLGACLADDMGLGKTVQVIAYLLSRPRGKHLVVCPTSVLTNWEREIEAFGPSIRVRRHHGLDRQELDLEGCDLVLTTYGVLSRDLAAMQAVEWDVVILDEAQAIKNPDAQRARSARALKANHRVTMTGTPIENRLEELWSLMEFLSPGLLGPRGAFRRNIAMPIERFGDEEVASQLRRGMHPFLLRRLKTDPTVIDDLPDKIERRMYTPLRAEQQALYAQVIDERMAEIQDSEGIERRGRVLAMLTALKQICNHPSHYLGDEGPMLGRSGKLEAVLELLDSIVESDERALIFTQYREMGVRLQQVFLEEWGEKVPFLHGGTTAGGRAAMVRAFQDDPFAPPVLIISLRAGGTGLNLTRATHVIHFDRWWNPAVEDQATDRAYRIGQRRNVLVHKLISTGTLEERIDRMLDEKRELADQVVGGGEGWITELDDNALRSLVALGAIGEEAD